MVASSHNRQQPSTRKRQLRASNAEAKKTLASSVLGKKKKPSNSTAANKKQKKVKTGKSAEKSNNKKKKKSSLVSEAKKKKALEKKQKEKERKEAKLEALKKKKEEQKKKKLAQALAKKEKQAEQKRKRKAKMELQKEKRAELLKAKKEKDILKKAAEQEKRKAAQEAARQKREEEAAKEKEQKNIFRIAEKAVKKGELIFDNGSLMMSSETEMSFSQSFDHHEQEQQQQQTDENSAIAAAPSSSNLMSAENTLLKLPSDQLDKLGIDKKSLQKSVSSIMAAKNRSPQDSCCVCEEAWKPSRISSANKKKLALANNNTSAKLHQDGDDSSVIAPSTTSANFDLSFVCSECTRPVHKNCLHHGLIRGWDLEKDIENAISEQLINANEPEPNLFDTVVLGQDESSPTTVNSNNNNNSSTKKSVIPSVKVSVLCVVCRSGKMPSEVFLSNNNNGSNNNSSNTTRSPLLLQNYADELVPLSPPELADQDQADPPNVTTENDKNDTLVTSSVNEDHASPPRQATNNIMSSTFKKGSHKYDFSAAAKRQTKAALEVAPVIFSSSLPAIVDNFAQELSHYLLRDGFVVIPTRGIYSEEKVGNFVQQQQKRCLSLLAGFLKSYEVMLNNEGSAPSLEGGFSNFRERGKGRYEMIHKQYLEEPVTEFVENSIVAPSSSSSSSFPDQHQQPANNIIMKVLAKSFSGKSFSKISSGCFIAESGASKQNWHTDGPSLALPEHMDLLPYAINIFIPLINVDSSNGTCFLPGSHLDSSIDGPDNLTAAGSNANPLLKQRQQQYAQNFVAPKISAGDVLLFDYRVWHRGLGNSGTATRPVVYATYSPDWFVDSQNFSQSRYKKQLEPIF